MKIDWQMYEDGQLDPDEMRIADEILRTDEKARKELEGLRSFRKIVRGAALSESVPHSRLRQILRNVVGKGQAPVSRRTAVTAVLVASAAAMAFLAFNLFVVQPTEQDGEERRVFANETDARTWASSISGVDLPTLQLASLGKFNSVHCGRNWACFDYSIDGQLVHVYVKKNNATVACNLGKNEKQTLVVKNDISLAEKDFTVSVQGATDEVRWKVVNYANNTPNAIY